MDRQAVRGEMERARVTFHRLLSSATEADLLRPTNGTRWTNRELLFHMLFGYLVVRALLVLVRVFGRLPDGVSRGFARVLDASSRPFHAVNYFGSWGGGHVVPPARMAVIFDRVIAAIERRLERESDASLRRGMHYPVRWDPFFKDFMTLADIYRYPTQHFEFHRRQLTLEDAD